MEYKKGAIANFLGKPVEDSSSTLSALFNTDAQQRFARTIKPEEIIAHKIQRAKSREDDLKAIEEEVAALKKKEKKDKKKKLRIRPRKDEEDGSTYSADVKDSVVATVSEVVEEGDVADKDRRTAFIGNIPISETVKSITKFCSEFGEVESVRLRSVPISGTAVDEAGNQDLVRKICVHKGKFGEQKGSTNAYVVFKSVDSVNKCLLANNRVLGKRHIRVDKVNPTLFDTKRTVFLGGLPHYADEEELREHFANVCITRY